MPRQARARSKVWAIVGAWLVAVRLLFGNFRGAGAHGHSCEAGAGDA
ncbi:hypothetical protein ACWGE1_22265 [Streptomyces sp. NPDC054932]